jgi:hypothetical protein
MVRVALLIGCLVCAGVAAHAEQRDQTSAGQHFERGNDLYNRGEYTAAIEAFAAANRIAPHPMALFSIARCHESLGDVARAFGVYKQALAVAARPDEKQKIAHRLELLRSRRYKVFVNSQPPGARVTVDGRAAPEPGKTPLILRLKPGEHVLLLRREGHQLATQRVVVEVGREQPVDLELASSPAPCPDCPPPKKPTCPRLEWLAEKEKRILLGVQGATGLSSNRPFAGGAGLQVHGIYRRFVFGGQFQFLTFATHDLPVQEVSDGVELNRNTINWLLMQVEGGWMVPFNRVVVFGTLGVGLFYERHKFSGWEVSNGKRGQSTTENREDVGFVWSIGAGVQAMINAWASIGGNLRLGMMHGSRTHQDDPTKTESSANAPFGTWSLVASLHF